MKKEYLILLGVLLLGIIARIMKFDDPDLVMDTVAYSRLGKNLIERGVYAFGENYNMGIFFPPGYPIFIGVTDLIFKNLFFSAKLVSFIGSCISILLAYVLGRELYDENSGLFAALLFAIYPVIILLSVQGYSDALFIMFLMLSIYLFFRSLKTENAIIYPCLGAAIASAYYMRPEGIFLLLLPFLQLFGVFNNKLGFNKKYLFKVFLVLLIFTMMVSPYILFLKSYTGKFNLSGKGNVSMILGKFGGEYEYHDIVNAPENYYDRVAFSLNEEKTQLLAWGKEINFSLKDYIVQDPVQFMKKYQKNVLQQIQVLIKLLIPVIIPLFFAFFYRDLFLDRRKFIFLLLPAMFFLIYPMFIIIEKQTLLIVVFLMIFASGGFSNSSSVIHDLARYYGAGDNNVVQILSKSIKPLILVILVVTGLSYLQHSGFQHFDPAHAKPEEHRHAGSFLKKKLSPDYESLNIMGRKPYVSFYSGSRFTMLPYAGVSDVLNFARLHHVDYIVIDERSLSKWDSYPELMEMHTLSENVELVYDDHSGKLIKLFKIKGRG